MNDQKTDATENGNKLETPASPETQPDTPKPSGTTGNEFVPKEGTGSVPVITTLDTPAEAPPDLDIDLIDVPILTQVVEAEDEQNEDCKRPINKTPVTVNKSPSNKAQSRGPGTD